MRSVNNFRAFAKIKRAYEDRVKARSVAQIAIAVNSTHFCARQGEHDRFGQLSQTEWLREKLRIGAELVGHQRGIREAGHKENGQVGPSAARLTRQVNAGHATGQENIGQQ
jgi:hypothetical protein